MAIFWNVEAKIVPLLQFTPDIIVQLMGETIAIDKILTRINTCVAWMRLLQDKVGGLRRSKSGRTCVRNG